MYLDSWNYYKIFEDNYNEKERENYIKYNQMSETSNRIRQMENGEMYYDVAYREKIPYNSSNRNYMAYDQLVMDNNTMHNINYGMAKNNGGGVVRYIKSLLCCMK
jgi:hypothetical protein